MIDSRGQSNWRFHSFILWATALVATAHAQAPTPAADAASAPPQATTLQRVEITGGRADETQQRRESTASKIVVGRDEIERFGDSTLGELLKRLPGVTIQGPPGRGGNIRMRGLGSGYTQILLDGERVPQGFSIDSIPPEQIERIEILRAPTAETGARAVAGTINIVTREAFRKRVNDVRVAASAEHGNIDPILAGTRNESIGDWTVNISPSLQTWTRDTDSVTTTVDQSLVDGSTTLAQTEQSQSHERRLGLHLSGRLQWRGEQGDTLTLAPFLMRLDGPIERHAVPQQSVGATPLTYDEANSHDQGTVGLSRLNAQWGHGLADGTRLEWRGSFGRSRIAYRLRREETGAVNRTIDEDFDIRDDTFSTAGKLSKLLDNDHSLVSGVELETLRRNEQHTNAENGVPQVLAFGDNLRAATSRMALYAQDEWSLTPQWSTHAGLRWEGISARGGGEDGSAPSNRSSVLTPLLHAVWKPDPKSRDQIRLSLTRSYRAPALQDLVARPTLSTRFPASGGNQPTSPDRAGNPALKPELATGVDLAVERYLPGGGMLSASVFHRRIRDMMRSMTQLEAVSWSTEPRWVSRPQNVGDAITQGLELEAKFRASDLWSAAPLLDLRANASFFRSQVKSVPGPDNRLDQQPGATANLGADYLVRGTPLSLGGNLNWTPAYSTRISDMQTLTQGRKLVVDAYLLWTVNPGVRLRLSGSNLAALDQQNGSMLDFPDSSGTGLVRETSQTTTRSYPSWLLRLEMKL